MMVIFHSIFDQILFEPLIYDIIHGLTNCPINFDDIVVEKVLEKKNY